MDTDVRDALVKCLHPLPDGWEWQWQDEVFDIQGGTQPPASVFVSEPQPGYVRLVQIRDYYSDSHITYIPDSMKLRKCEPDDVMIARYGSSADTSASNSLGRICRGLSGAYNVALAKAIPRSVSKDFLYYLLQSRYFQDPIRGSGSRSVQSGFNKQSLRVIALPVPPPDEQAAIAHILGTLDDKIELNRRMNATLEEMVRALFKSWFVDFDPVRAKAAGRQPAGMDAETAALFPDSFEDSELGEIPALWHVRSLAESTSLLSRGISPSYIESGGVLVINQKCVRGHRVDPAKGRRHNTQKRRVDGRVLQIGDVLVNSTGVGTLGRVAPVLMLRIYLRMA